MQKNESADNTTPTEVTGITPLEDQVQKQQDNKGTVPTSIEPIGQGDAVAEPSILNNKVDQKYKEDLHNSIQRELKLDFVPNEKLLEGRDADGLRDKQKDIKKRLSVLKTLMKSIDC